MRRLDDIHIQHATRVLLRADFNVSVEDGRIEDDFRIQNTLPTIEYLLKKEARVLILAHLGRPDGIDMSLSLKPVAEHLSKLLNRPVAFFEDIEHAAKELPRMNAGTVAVLENVRFYKGERAGDDRLGHQLADLGEAYVNDAFGTAHRRHTSTYILPRLLPSAAGLLMQREVETFTEVRKDPARPFTLILGGAKVKSKIQSLMKLIGMVDNAALGGLIANTILAAQGTAVGRSIIEEEIENIERLNLTDPKMHLPLDVVVAKEPEDDAETSIAPVGNIGSEDMILDIGPETVNLFSNIIQKSGTVVWNGPMGLSEKKPFRAGTENLAAALKDTKAEVIVGGGDVMTAIDRVGARKNVDHASTGGGAMLEFLATGTLPALDVLSSQKYV